MSTKQEVKTLSGGWLVSLKSSNTGNTRYHREDIEYPHENDFGEQQSEWNTRKTVADAAEQDEANKLRDKCRSLITGVCAQSEHGLMCPDENADELFRRIDEVDQLLAEFNATSIHNTVVVNVFYARIAPDDVRAARLVFDEIERFMDTMVDGLRELDVKKVRAICDKAKNVEQMVSPEAQGMVGLAIEVARNAATEIKKAGEAVVVAIDYNAIETIQQARGAFLDIGAAGFDTDRPDTGGRALDLVV